MWSTAMLRAYFLVSSLTDIIEFQHRKWSEVALGSLHLQTVQNETTCKKSAERAVNCRLKTGTAGRLLFPPGCTHAAPCDPGAGNGLQRGVKSTRLFLVLL